MDTPSFLCPYSDQIDFKTNYNNFINLFQYLFMYSLRLLLLCRQPIPASNPSESANLMYQYSHEDLRGFTLYIIILSKIIDFRDKGIMNE